MNVNVCFPQQCRSDPAVSGGGRGQTELGQLSDQRGDYGGRLCQPVAGGESSGDAAELLAGPKGRDN